MRNSSTMEYGHNVSSFVLTTVDRYDLCIMSVAGLKRAGFGTTTTTYLKRIY
jgi:hypothetical protein